MNPKRLALYLLTTSALLGAFSCSGQSEDQELKPCPDPERMYRDFSQGGKCVCDEPERLVLNAAGDRCIECLGDCDGKSCGDDGCGRLCGDCPMGRRCNAAYECEVICVSDCEGKECGVDECGRSCATCPDGSQCVANECQETIEPPPSYANACCTPYGACYLTAPAYEGLSCVCFNVFYGAYFAGLTCSFN